MFRVYDVYMYCHVDESIRTVALYFDINPVTVGDI
jgi:hypothetical protein